MCKISQIVVVSFIVQIAGKKPSQKQRIAQYYP